VEAVVVVAGVAELVGSKLDEGLLTHHMLCPDQPFRDGHIVVFAIDIVELCDHQKVSQAMMVQPHPEWHRSPQMSYPEARLCMSGTSILTLHARQYVSQ
jgi:hypothetical protein